MHADQLAPFLIKRADDAESVAADEMRWSWQDSAERVLSSLLVETPEVLPIRSRCCRLARVSGWAWWRSRLQAATANLDAATSL